MVLRGLGASVALPLREAMGPDSSHAEPGDRTSPPLRVAFLYVPNGAHMPDRAPRTPGALFELPAILNT